MIAAAFLLALCLLGDETRNWVWDRVTDEDAVEYRVEVAERIPFFYECLDDEGNPTTCVEYPAWSSLQWSVADVVPQVPEVPEGFALCTTWDEGGIAGSIVPQGRDGLIYVNVRAVDASGNVGD